jgi:hypothetical protein
MIYLSEAKDPALAKLEKTDFHEQLKPGKRFSRTEDETRALT